MVVTVDHEQVEHEPSNQFQPGADAISAALDDLRKGGQSCVLVFESAGFVEQRTRIDDVTALSAAFRIYSAIKALDEVSRF